MNWSSCSQLGRIIRKAIEPIKQRTEGTGLTYSALISTLMAGKYAGTSWSARSVVKNKSEHYHQFRIIYENAPDDMHVRIDVPKDYNKQNGGYIHIYFEKGEASHDEYYHEEDRRYKRWDIKEAISAFPSLNDKLVRRIASLEKAEREADIRAEKRKKIQELRENSVDAWLEQICGELTVPYAIHEMQTRRDLYIEPPDSPTIIKFEIPLARFQEVLPSLPEAIDTWLAMVKDSSIKVLIENAARQPHNLKWYESEHK
ncbi:hypothetical protein FACS1894184_19410 [Clostridia bacterium]|nr:hypothetical protein FACS1894184_19410 [Clostridia bacterium]